MSLRLENFTMIIKVIHSLMSALLIALFATAAHAETSIAIIGGNVVDVENKRILKRQDILIEDGTIVRIGKNLDLPDGVEIIDAKDKWITPGLMNMHVHFDLVLPGEMAQALQFETVPERTLRAKENAKAALLSGTTTIRSPGDADHIAIAIGKAGDRGEILAPRVFSAGKPLSPTGGHGLSPIEPGIDGEDAAMNAVRKEIAGGATWIKLMISRGIASFSGDIAASDMTYEEMRAAVDIAHRRGVKVTAHSGSPAATMEALSAGVDGFEHGYYLTETEFAAMKEAGAWYVPTIVVSQEGALEFFEKIGSPPWYLARVKSVGVNHWSALQTAIRMDVNIAMGSDQHPAEPNMGTVASIHELELYQKAGMTPIEALRAGTLSTATLLDISDRLGIVKQGYLADLLIMSENPSADISALRTIGIVMKDGVVVRNDWN
jgi:imidazolonepropionase-like amidohydrolase